MALPRKPKNTSSGGSGGQSRGGQQPQGSHEQKSRTQSSPRPQPKRPQRPSVQGSRPSRPSRPQSVENPYDTEEDRDVFSGGNSRDDYYYDDEVDNSGDYENDYDDNEYDDVGFDDLEEQPVRPSRRPRVNSRGNSRAGESNARRRPQRAPVSRDSYEDDYYEEEEDDSAVDFNSYDSYDEEEDILAIDYESLGDDEDEIEKMERRRAAHDIYDVNQDEVKKAARSKKRKANEKKNKNHGFFNSKDKKRKKDKRGADVYVNEKTGKLEPYAKRKIKVSEFDDRKNRQKKATYIQFTALALMAGLVGLGVKNAIIPPDTLTQEEVQSISLATVGETNFPEERAKVVAENFVQAYLAVGNRDISSDALSYFYTGVVSGDFEYDKVKNTSSSDTMRVSGGFNQKVILRPSAYESVSIDDNTGYFTVGALVKPDASLELKEGESKPKLEGAEAKWIFFNVNIYYDDETDKMYVTRDSPTLIPNKDVGAITEAPEMGKIGNGVEANDATVEEIAPVIYGYVSGYADSSSENTRFIQQYLSPNATDEAKNGLDGMYELPGTEENSISYEAYESTKPNELKVLVKVSWANKINVVGSTEEVGSARYTSNYIATLVRSADSGWLVQNFNSMKFVPKEGSTASAPQAPVEAEEESAE